MDGDKPEVLRTDAGRNVVVVLSDEARNDVARFVSEARDTARASAERRVDLATNIRLLPQFLRELRPDLRIAHFAGPAYSMHSEERIHGVRRPSIFRHISTHRGVWRCGRA